MQTETMQPTNVIMSSVEIDQIYTQLDQVGDSFEVGAVGIDDYLKAIFNAYGDIQKIEDRLRAEAEVAARKARKEVVN